MKNLKLKHLLSCSLLFFCGALIAQQSVEGIVSDETGPLPGVSILEKGTSNGVVSDFDGNYSITVSNNGPMDVLECSRGANCYLQGMEGIQYCWFLRRSHKFLLILRFLSKRSRPCPCYWTSGISLSITNLNVFF